MIEAVVTFGPDTRVHVSGETAHEVLALLTQVEKSEIPLTLGRVRRGSGVQESLGRNLGAELVEEQPKAEIITTAEYKRQMVKAEKDGAPVAGAFSPKGNIPPGVKIVDGAPIVLGQKAWLVNGKLKDGSPYQAFIHPDVNVDRSLPRTSDPDDPRLAAGDALFWRYL